MLEASKQVYTSLLQPLFDYTDVAWGGGISEGCCKELHRLQNRAALITGYIMEGHLKWLFPCA